MDINDIRSLGENKASISLFMKEITHSLGKAVQTSLKKKFNREKIWQEYFTLQEVLAKMGRVFISGWITYHSHFLSTFN